MSRHMRADSSLGRGGFFFKKSAKTQRQHDGLTTASVICTLIFHVLINMQSSRSFKLPKIFLSSIGEELSLGQKI
jgi:hypothetical protein